MHDTFWYQWDSSKTCQKALQLRIRIFQLRCEKEEKGIACQVILTSHQNIFEPKDGPMKQTTSAKIRLMATTTTYTNEDSFNSTGSHEYHSGNSGNLELDTSPLQGFIKVCVFSAWTRSFTFSLLASNFYLNHKIWRKDCLIWIHSGGQNEIILTMQILQRSQGQCVIVPPFFKLWAVACILPSWPLLRPFVHAQRIFLKCSWHGSNWLDAKARKVGLPPWHAISMWQKEEFFFPSSWMLQLFLTANIRTGSETTINMLQPSVAEITGVGSGATLQIKSSLSLRKTSLDRWVLKSCTFLSGQIWRWLSAFMPF